MLSGAFWAEQEIWLSPTERASVSAISRIWLPHESHAGMSLPKSKSLRYILASLAMGTPLGLYRGKCYTDRKKIQCLSKASQHVPIYHQPFPSNSTRNRKLAILAHFLHIYLLSPGYASMTIAVNVTWIEREFNAGQMHRSIYPDLSSTISAIYRWRVINFQFSTAN